MLEIRPILVTVGIGMTIVVLTWLMMDTAQLFFLPALRLGSESKNRVIMQNAACRRKVLLEQAAQVVVRDGRCDAAGTLLVQGRGHETRTFLHVDAPTIVAEELQLAHTRHSAMAHPTWQMLRGLYDSLRRYVREHHLHSGCGCCTTTRSAIGIERFRWCQSLRLAVKWLSALTACALLVLRVCSCNRMTSTGSLSWGNCLCLLVAYMVDPDAKTAVLEHQGTEGTECALHPHMTRG